MSMSTTIYNGLKLTKMNMEGLKHFASRVREPVEAIQGELYAKVMADICTDIIDSRILTEWCNHKECEMKRYGKAANMGSPIHIAYFSVRDRQKKIKTTQERDIDVDFEFILSILPIRGKMLAIPYTEQAEFLKIIRSMSEVSDYSYWNNSDRPNGVSAKEWSQRKKDWDEALPGLGIPNQNGFSITLTHEYVPIPNTESIIKHIKPLESRIKHHATETVMGIAFEAIKKSHTGDVKEFSPWRAIIDASKFIETTEGKLKVAKFIKEYQDMLREITVEDLLSEERP